MVCPRRFVQLIFDFLQHLHLHLLLRQLFPLLVFRRRQIRPWDGSRSVITCPTTASPAGLLTGCYACGDGLFGALRVFGLLLGRGSRVCCVVEVAGSSSAAAGIGDGGGLLLDGGGSLGEVGLGFEVLCGVSSSTNMTN